MGGGGLFVRMLCMFVLAVCVCVCVCVCVSGYHGEEMLSCKRT